ncbi:TIGR00269 family protein [Candidatus Woesearchaeota archaeon]|nr:TIGR00269 family protein [Candidatus Woesearchaeota archaeon]MBW3006193.1 TIGR00269 family protein [Candidatus Woesearchaeota archaeon]
MVSDKEFVKKFEQKVKNTIKKFDLISPKDKLLVAVSGGKDSTAALYLLKKLGYDVEAVTVDVGAGDFSEINLSNIEKFCSEKDILLHKLFFEGEFNCSIAKIPLLLKKKGINMRSCAVCGVLRRYLINKFVRKTTATKVVTGHNASDEAQVYLMNLFKNKQEMNARLGPMPGLIRSKLFVPRIKPLYLITEDEVEKYSKIMNFPVKYGRCPFAFDAYRNYIRTFLNDYKKINPDVHLNIVKHFLKELPMLKKKFATSKKVNVCKKCGEPAKEKICRTCQILSHLQKAL